MTSDLKERSLLTKDDEKEEQKYPNYFLVGKIDGFVDGALIEIKNRVNRFYGPIPFYDRIQILCYLYLLQEKHRLPQGTLIEQILRNKEVQKRETIIHWDSDYWNKMMLPHAVYFLDTFSNFQKDEDQCKYYFGLENERKKLEFLKKIFKDLPGVQLERFPPTESQFQPRKWNPSEFGSTFVRSPKIPSVVRPVETIIE